MDEEMKKLVIENNSMLKKLVFYQKWNQIYRIVYWLIIILSAIGAFYFVQPLLSSLSGAYGVDTSSFSNALK
jgi:hypothetical protein